MTTGERIRFLEKVTKLLKKIRIDVRYITNTYI